MGVTGVAPRLTLFATNTHAVVEKQVLVGELAHHAGRFKEGLSGEAKRVHDHHGWHSFQPQYKSKSHQSPTRPKNKKELLVPSLVFQTFVYFYLFYFFWDRKRPLSVGVTSE